MFGKSKLIFPAILLIAIVLFSILRQEESAKLEALPEQTIPEPETQVIKPNHVASDNLVTAENEPVKADVVEEVIERNCISREEFQALNHNSATREWIHRHIGYGREDAENYMDMATLKEQAEVGNAYAMFVMGMHHLHRARYDAEYDPWMRSDVDAKSAYFTKPLDLEELAKAEHWLYQAGFHGLLGAFGELSKVYVAHLKHAKKQIEKNESEIRQWVLKINAVMIFQGDLLPEYFTKAIHRMPETASDRDYLLLQAELERLESEWTINREKLGLPQEVQLEVPEDVKALNQAIDCMQTQ